ncbi:MAG: cupredoxin domain-containing protein [Proteobacteria bacterium]|nr:cupredoxin domain-containing protein [Pseudomonadota bacterium]
MRMRWCCPAFGALAIFAGAAIAGAVVPIAITDLVFSPAEITVKVGDTVEWTNNDFVDHTATATDGEWDVAIPSGKSAMQQMAKAGTITYFCRVHPGMTGKIHVVSG